MKFHTLSKKAMGCMYTATLLGIAIAAAILTFIMYYFSLFSYPILSALYAFLILTLAITPNIDFFKE